MTARSATSNIDVKTAAMRLAIVGNHAQSMLNFRGPLIEALTARGVEVYALAPDYSEAERTAIMALGARPVDFHLTRAGISPLGDIVSSLQLVRILRLISPDVALSFAVKPVIYGTLAAWAARVKHRFALVEGLGHVFIAEGSLKTRILKGLVSALYRVALSKTDATFFLNEDDRADFISAGLVTPAKAKMLGAIGVDLNAWQMVPPVTAPLTFLFIGRLLREKGLFEFIEAARLVKAAHPEIRFVVLGAPDSNPSSISIEQMETWVQQGLIVWPGHTDVKPWLAETSVFVLPSYREGVPRSTQEAMAMGRAIVTTDVPGCRDTVVDGQNGFLVPAKDAGALGDAMLRFVNQPALVQAMGARSRALAEQRFDVHTANALMIAAMGL